MALGALRGLKTFKRVSVEGVVEAVSATYRATAKNKSEFQLLSQVGPLYQGENYQKVDLHLKDENNTQIKVTFWNQDVKKVQEVRERKKVHLYGVQWSPKKGQLGSTSTTTVEVNSLIMT